MCMANAWVFFAVASLAIHGAALWTAPRNVVELRTNDPLSSTNDIAFEIGSHAAPELAAKRFVTPSRPRSARTTVAVVPPAVTHSATPPSELLRTPSTARETMAQPAWPTGPSVPQATAVEPESPAVSIASPRLPHTSNQVQSKADESPLLQNRRMSANPVQGWLVRFGQMLAHQALRNYPLEARRARHQGTVWVSIKISRHGQITGLAVQRTSGYSSLDRAAVAALRTVHGLPAPPESIASQREALLMPIVYRLQ